MIQDVEAKLAIIRDNSLNLKFLNVPWIIF
jgi:hypothetical protein